MKRAKNIQAFVFGFLGFFLMSAFSVTCCFLVFFSFAEIDRGNLDKAAILTFINVLFIAVILSTAEYFRRRYTVEKYVRRIDEALSRITRGDFGVRLRPDDSAGSFAPIMESIDSMAQELSSLETLRQDFVANVSHEIKTPLAVINNYASLLMQEGVSEGQRLEYAGSISSAAGRLGSLVSNMLRLNRLENQQIFPAGEDFDLGEQLCECLLPFEKVWEEKNIELEASIEENVIVKSDRELLELVWTNLLSNAFKFTGEGGRVCVRVRRTESGAEVSVEDSGCGMSAQVGAHIFEKFYQGDSSHATEGNGLGLALVKRIMDIIGGEISVKSELGKGSCFIIKGIKNGR